jgi:hypothetical protein
MASSRRQPGLCKSIVGEEAAADEASPVQIDQDREVPVRRSVETDCYRSTRQFDDFVNDLGEVAAGPF